MIEIAVDEKACVSCCLCADICPTEVFTFDQTRGVPDVAKPGECFGCLSCSEICPSRCIDHRNVVIAESHHSDAYATRLASRLGIDSPGIAADPEAVARAMADLGIRLLSVAEVFKRTLGGSLPAVGTMAGRTLARHLPRHRSPENLEEVLEQTIHRLAPAWQIVTSISGDQLTVTVKDCFVREVCRREDIDLGGELCVLFYNYLAGYIGRLGDIRLRLMNADRCDRCTYQVKIYPNS